MESKNLRIFVFGIGICHFHDIVGKQSIRYYFAFSQKPRKLIGNNVTRNNCDKAFGMGCLNQPYISNASRHRRGAFLFDGLRFPFRGCLIAERNKSITPFLRLGVIDSSCS